VSTQPGRWTFLRDATSYFGGWALILKQAGIIFDPPAQASLPLVVTGGLLIGVPGLLQIVLWWVGNRAGISGPPSGPALPPSPSLDTPSSGLSGADA